MIDKKLPDWMSVDERYEPAKDHDGFMVKTILKLLSLLERFRENGRAYHNRVSAPLKFFSALLFIVLISVSKNLFFTFIMVTVVLVASAVLPGKAMKTVVTTAFGAMLLAAVFTIPALFLGSPHSLITIALKVFASVGLLQLVAVTTPWNEVSGAMKWIFIPDLFILTFDLTMKYIAILGNICLDILTALRLRAVGKNRTKGKSFAGLLGVTFLKSKEMSEDMYQAMVLRGFTGEYHRPVRSRQNANQNGVKKALGNGLFALVVAAGIVLFAVLK